MSAGRVDIVELLLSSGADINIREDEDWTPLHFAAAHGHLAIVRLLLERGADVNALGNGRRTFFQRLLGRRVRVTPRSAALSAGHVEIAELLGRHPGRP